jgi:hypothetical protein
VKQKQVLDMQLIENLVLIAIASMAFTLVFEIVTKL